MNLLRHLTGHRWTALIVFTLLSLACFVDSFVMGALLTPIKESLHTTDEQLGRLNMVTILIYILAMPVAGYVGDRHARKWYIFFSLLVWSVGAVGSGYADSFDALLVWRALLGAGTGIFSALAPGWLVDIFPATQRSVALAVLMSTGQVAAWLAYHFGGLVAAHSGWQEAFIVTGLPGFVLLPFVALLREPRRGEAEGLTAEEIAHPTWREVTALFQDNAFLFYLVAYALRMVGVSGLFIWGAVLFHRQYGVDNQQAVDFVGGAYLFAGAPGIFLGGYLAGRLARSFSAAYSFWLVGGELLAAFSFGIVLVTLPGLALAKALFLTAVFFSGNCWGVIRPLLFQLAPVRSRNMAFSISLIAECIGDAFLAAELIGFTSDHFGIAHALFLVPISYSAAAIMWALLGTLQILRERRSRQHSGAAADLSDPSLPEPAV